MAFTIGMRSSNEEAVNLSLRPVFVLSLPRSGSTLLQRMLGAHTQVATAPETWLLLPALYALRPGGTYAEYGHATASKALRDLIHRLPGEGDEEYLEAVRIMALHMYEALSPPGTTWFLDKTPRYSLVAEELRRTFPEAVIVMLWRNPLAVVASLTDTFDGGRFMPELHAVDLYDSLSRLCGVVEAGAGNYTTVRYEDLVEHPEREIRRIIAAMDIDWEPDLLADFAKVDVTGVVGDPTGVHRYGSVSTASMQRWRNILHSTVRVAWCRRYLQWIGPDRLSTMGYNQGELLECLDGIPTRRLSAIVDAARLTQSRLYAGAEVKLIRDKFGGRAGRPPRWHT